MSDNHSSHDSHDVSKDIKKYVGVFIALLVGTIITVLAAQIHFGSTTMNIVIALFIASVKAFLVAGYFMHLLSEKKTIYAILLSTVFFVIGLMALTIFSFADIPGQ